MNISDIAKLAGVSTAAVSRYLNNGPLSQEKKERIAQAIAETGYRPDQSARTLRTGKMNQIGIILPRIDMEFVGRTAKGIMDVCRERGYQSLMVCTESDMDVELEYINLLEQNRVAGAIFLATSYTALHQSTIEKLKLPLVVLGSKVNRLNCVYSDDAAAAADITRLMLKKGRKNIGFIGFEKTGSSYFTQRRTGVEDALSEAGLSLPPDHVVLGGLSPNAGYRAVEKLLNQVPDIDGIVCASDYLALGAVHALREKGICVPEDISIAGMDDHPMDSLMEPAITSVHLFYYESGQSAANMLIDMLEQDTHQHAVHQTMLNYYVAERQSI